MVERQSQVREMLEKNRKEGKPTQGLTDLFIDISRNLEDIMRQDKEVGKAMDALRPLSSKSRRLEGRIRYLEKKIAEYK